MEFESIAVPSSKHIWVYSQHFAIAYCAITLPKKKKGCETCERSFILQLKKERRTILLSLSCFVSSPEEAANSASFLDIEFYKKLQRNSGKA